MIVSNGLKIKQFVNKFYSSNTYIIHQHHNNLAWMIDCGDSKPIIEYLNTNNLKLKGIFLTHVHYDHIYGLNELYELDNKFILYTSKEGYENLFNSKLNFSKYHERDFKYVGNNISIIGDNDNIKLFPEVILHCQLTPGHDWSCITFNIGDIWFTGDSLIPGLKTVTTFPKSNKISANKSEHMILSKITDSSIIYPGHGKIVNGNKIFEQ